MTFRQISLTDSPAILGLLIGVFMGAFGVHIGAALGTAELQAQTLVSPGDPSIDGARIKTGTVQFKIGGTQNGAAHDFATVTRETSVIKLRGRNVLRIVQKGVSPLGSSTDTTVVELKTLAPVSMHWYAGTESVAIDYKGHKVTGQRHNADGSVKQIAQTLSQNVFDANMFELLIGALPLKTGYVVKLPFYRSEKNDIDWNTLNVAGERIVDGVPAWDVVVSGAEEASRYAIDKATGRSLGSEYEMMGVRMTMKPVKH